MTLLVLVVLAMLWAAFLVPPLVRARTEGRPADSISAFRRQLATLRRAAPVGSRPLAAPRPHAPGARPARTSAGARPTVTSLAAHRHLVAARPRGRMPVSPHALAAAGLPSARARTQRRRRDVFTALLCAAGATLVLGLLPQLRVLLVAHVVVDVLLVAYVALLIRQRTLLAEREMKVRFLPRSAEVEPALLRRSAN